MKFKADTMSPIEFFEYQQLASEVLNEMRQEFIDNKLETYEDNVKTKTTWLTLRLKKDLSGTMYQVSLPSQGFTHPWRYWDSIGYLVAACLAE